MEHHTGLHVCQACLKSYKRPEHLRRHQLSHSTDRPFECALCRSTFQRSDVLKRHLKTCDFEADRPVSKRLALSRPYHASGFSEPHEQGVQSVQIDDGNPRSDEFSALSFDHIAGWISGGFSNHDFDQPSESWQDFLDLASGTQTPFAARDDINEDNKSLHFLANFTSKTGLLSSFDCGTPEQRQRVAVAFDSDAAKSGTLASPAPSRSSDPSTATLSDTITQPSIDEHVAQMAVRHWLSDPLSLKSHEIVIAIQGITTRKSRKSALTLTWSDTVQEACVRFFSPMSIRRYLYFYWTIWHPNVNILHKPTFDASSSKPELIAAMSIMGACVSPDSTDLEDAKRWFDAVEEIVFDNDDFRDDVPASVFYSSGDLQWRPAKLRALQAAYMVCLYQTWEGTNMSKRRIRRHRYGTVVGAVRDTGIANAKHPDYSQQDQRDFSFTSFAVREELIRVILWIFLLDTAFVIFNNLPPRMVIREMRMSMAKPELCFQAMTPEECFDSLQQDQRGANMGLKIADDFTSAFEALYQAVIDEEVSTALADLGPLNLFAMTSAMYSLIFHYQSSFSCRGSMDSIRQAQKSWGRVWDIYTELFSQDVRHAPAKSSMQDLAPDDMWRRIGFTRYASEYWLLGKFVVDRLSGPHLTVEGVDNPTHGLQAQMGTSGTEFIGPLLDQYDQTSMQQVNVLIADFQKICIT